MSRDSKDPSICLVLKVDPRHLEIWNSKHRRFDKIFQWDRSLRLKLGDLVKVSDELAILAKLKTVFEVNNDGDVRVPFVLPYLWQDLCEHEAHRYVGYSPIFGPVAAFFDMDLEYDTLYWTWARLIPPNLQKLRDESEIYRIDFPVHWMVAKPDSENLLIRPEDLKNSFYTKKASGVVIENDQNFDVAWNSSFGRCAIFADYKIPIGKWLDFYVLRIPSFKNPVGIYWNFVEDPENYPAIAMKSPITMLEVQFYVSSREFPEKPYYLTPKLGYVRDADQVLKEDDVDFMVTGLVKFNYGTNWWVLDRVISRDWALVGLVCWIDQREVHLFCKDLEGDEEKTKILRRSLFLPSVNLGSFYALFYDSYGQVCAAVETGSKFDVRIKGLVPMVRVKSWVQIYDRKEGYFIGYSREFGTEVVDNMKRLDSGFVKFKNLPEKCDFQLDLEYRDDPLFGLGWKVHQYSKIYNINDLNGRPKEAWNYIRTNGNHMSEIGEAHSIASGSIGGSTSAAATAQLPIPASSIKKRRKTEMRALQKQLQAAKETGNNESLDGQWDAPVVDDLVKVDE